MNFSTLFDSFRPTYSTPKVLERAGLSMSDIDVFEFHEAFAVSYHNTSGKKFFECVFGLIYYYPVNLLYILSL